MNVYDFDGTIYDGDSSIDFWKFSLKRRPLLIFFLFPTAVALFLYLFGFISKTRFKECFYKFLKYIPNIEHELNAFWNLHEVKIKKWYEAQKEPSDVVISASPEFLLKPVCDMLDIKLIASQVNKITGEYTGENCYGDEKVRRFREEYPNAEINNFYSDSRSDSPLTQMSNKAYMVGGDNIVSWDKYKSDTADKIKNTFFTLEFFRFVFCGGCATLINFFVSLFLSYYTNSTLAYVGGYAFAIFFNYTLNTYLTFKLPFSIIRFFKFVISYIPNFLILLTFVAVLLNIFHLPEIFVYLVAAIFALPLTFIFVKIFAFGSKVREKK